MTKVNPICGLCKVEKSIDDFYRDRKKLNGLSSYCRECAKQKSKGSYSRNPERAKESMRRWREKNPEINKAIKAKSSFGISREDYFNLDKVCVICGAKDNLCIDHSHQSGRIRGMLCHSCNKGLGFFKDNPVLLTRASDYLLGYAKADIFKASYNEVPGFVEEDFV